MSHPAQLDLPLAAPPSQAVPFYRESARATRLSIKVHYDGRVEVVVPKGLCRAEVEQFVISNQAWIDRARSGQLEKHPPVARQRPSAMTLTAVGEHWRLHRRAHKGKRFVAHLRPGSGPNQFDVCLDGPADDESMLRDAVRKLLIDRARQMFKSTLSDLAPTMNSRYRRVQVRDQKTRWGSFSSSGTISMNYAALFLNPDQMRYLCAHELAHYHHMDHSRRFWQCVEQVIPEARALDRQLHSTYDVLPPWLWV
ncbi:MAG: SprT family zinc-dependent metalloprotease [Pseudomonadota bacterium]